MKKIFYSLCLIYIATSAQAQTPVIKIVLNNPMKYFWCTISTKAENTAIQVDLGDGKMTNFTIGTSPKPINGWYTNDTIKIYGAGISTLNLNERNCIALDVKGAIDITELSCDHNQITTLDLSQNTLLSTLNCQENLLETLDLSHNTALINIDCNRNLLKSIVLSQNTALTALVCSNNFLNNLDVSHCTLLTKLDCSTNLLTSLDVSKNISLTYLACFANQLTTLDVSQNNALTAFSCSNNYLTSFIAPTNALIPYFSCNSNYLNFSTLPIKQSNWTYYTYSPQKDIKLPKRKYAIGEIIDLSDHLTSNGNTTIYTWKTVTGTTLTKDVDYTEDNGKFAFHNNQDKYIYCCMTNATFPNLTLTTEKLTIPSSTIAATLVTNYGIGNSFSFDIAASSDNKTIQVDWGDKVLTDYIIGSSISNVSGTLSGDTIKIYGLGITDLILQSKNLTLLDLTEATELRNLDCQSNNLNTLDLSKNGSLVSLKCQSNQLTTLNLSNNNALTSIQCQLNQIKSLTIPTNITLTDFQCQNNQLAFFSLPSKQDYWSNYIYSPQSLIKLAKNNYDGEFIDLSSQLYNSRTIYNWKTKGGTKLTSGVDYIQTSGKFIFIKNQNDSIFCEMTNTTFPNLILTTKAITVGVTPSITFTTTSPNGDFIAFSIGTTKDKTPILVDLGKNKYIIMNCSQNINILNETSNSNIVKIIGKGITSFSSGITLTSIDVAGANELTSLACSGRLTSLDVTKNPLLTKIDCNSSQLSNLDLSNNTALTELNCYYNQLTSLDLSKNTALTELNCFYNRLTTLDISKNTLLTELNCSNNQLTTLDVSKNTALTILYCHANKLKALDVSKNNALLALYCGNNQLTFSTLPLKQQLWSVYSYDVQGALTLPKRQYNIDEIIDLSSEQNINCHNTNYEWKTVRGKTLAKAVDYSEDNGKFTFLKTQSDYIFCQMSNEQFPGLTLYTDTIAITSTTPLITLSTNSYSGTVFSFTVGRTIHISKPIKVDWGNGIITDCTINYNKNKVEGILKGTTIKIYGIGVEYLSIASQNVFDINISETDLLRELDCHNNQLTSIDISEATSLGILDCSNNRLTSYNIKSNSLKSINCSSNQLVSLDISEATSLNSINCSSNKLSSLDISSNASINFLDCSYNEFTFNTLPNLNYSSQYYYSPQYYTLPKKVYEINEPIDLTSLYDSNGYNTTYTWKTDEILTQPVRYSYNNGLFKFQDACKNIYCVMNNASKPNLSIITRLINITQSTTSIVKNTLKVNIFPNPIRDILNVESEKSITKIEVYTITGVKIYEKQVGNSLNMAIPTANFPKGMLIVKIYGMDGVMEKKVLKD